MGKIVINVSTLSIPAKLVKGQDIIAKSTNNVNVPGNAASLAAFTTAQASFTAANAAYESVRQQLTQLMTQRETAQTNWLTEINLLAAFTETATGGEAAKIESSGFSVKAAPSNPLPVAQVENVKVTYTGAPGHSSVRWKRDSNADAYVLERSPEPITPTSWENVGTVTEAKYEGNGAIPGRQYWYRVAGVNRLGQGVWSEPALRPVM